MPDKPPGISTKRVEETKAALEEELTEPVLVTMVPTSIALPEEDMEPWFNTEPVVPFRDIILFKKSESDSLRVEAIKSPPVITEPVGVITMPLGLIRYREPVAFRRPAMEEREEPTTLFKVTPCPLLKKTCPSLPMENEFQFMIALEVFWFMVIEEPEEDMEPPPAAKEPPVGRTEAEKAELVIEINRTVITRAKRCLLNMDGISLASRELIFLQKGTIKRRYKLLRKSKNIKIPLDFLFA
jgi:hypothetical protein